ncbi:hypothetical protein A6P39_003985 [Streptomyces sp. FXJ1.172]|uniref:hypothetical protein n=1 Tax=Streptomyces sp. FXJ1.172 TaxID=710705 RepID=UPI001F46CC05|nr:hypothetical protein [Streptomyces sp. FXJ1.172]WEO93261.1 hypothetical protein A6P39_003985 [Streptomyces sp. FXJ1.172]
MTPTTLSSGWVVRSMPVIVTRPSPPAEYARAAPVRTSKARTILASPSGGVVNEVPP